MRYFSEKLLKLLGWKIEVEIDIPSKSVICVAPHTSNWDFILGQLFAWAIEMKSFFLMKDTWFFFPLGVFFKKLGGIPVDRTRNNSATASLIELFNKNDTFHLAITPEGTRGHVENWKTGFYNIAVGANVPILLAYIDYKKKYLGIKNVFLPSGEIEADMPVIQSFYIGVQGLNPEKFNLSN